MAPRTWRATCRSGVLTGTGTMMPRTWTILRARQPGLNASSAVATGKILALTSTSVPATAATGSRPRALTGRGSVAPQARHEGPPCCPKCDQAMPVGEDVKNWSAAGGGRRPRSPSTSTTSIPPTTASRDPGSRSSRSRSSQAWHGPSSSQRARQDSNLPADCGGMVIPGPRRRGRGPPRRAPDRPPKLSSQPAASSCHHAVADRGRGRARTYEIPVAFCVPSTKRRSRAAGRAEGIARALTVYGRVARSVALAWCYGANLLMPYRSPLASSSVSK